MSVVIPSLRGAIAVPGWAKNELWRRARAVPSLDLRFADNKSLTDAVTGASLVTFTRSSNGTFVGSDGVLQTAATDVPRFDHNPTTGESLGLLVEEQRTNLLLNSGTLSTQSVTVTAAAHTLSFTGTGTITLTGTSTAGPLVGTGTGESNRVSLAFAPTAGSLTLTVSGTVTNAQLEAGLFRTSYIPTTTAAATRNADLASITGGAFSGWYRQDEGTVFADARVGSGTFPYAYGISDGTGNNRIILYRVNAPATSSTAFDLRVDSGGSNSASFSINAATTRFGLAYKANDYAASGNGGAPSTDTSGTVPSVNQMTIGGPTFFQCNGTVSRFTFWPQRLSNASLQTLTQ